MTGGGGDLSFSLEDDLREPLLLMDGHSPARLVVKHRRCESAGQHGGWRKRGIGPYACHELGRHQGSHRGPHGALLCQPSS